MGKDKFPIPAQDPISGGELTVTELVGDESGVIMRGRFELPRFCRLNAEQMRFLETFLRCRGILSSVERELGISYPTVRSRLDHLLQVLDLPPAASAPSGDRLAEEKRHILDQLERGEITAEEAKEKMGSLK
jgi:hypothetical protein